MHELDLYWLAGLLEGEGCFGTTVNHKRYKGEEYGIYRYPEISLGMTDGDIVDRVAELFETKVWIQKPRSDKHQTVYRTALTGSRAKALMEKLYPLMGERRSRKIQQILTDIKG